MTKKIPFSVPVVSATSYIFLPVCTNPVDAAQDFIRSI